MTSRATREAVHYPVVEPVADSGTPGFVSLRQSATLEFYASVQMLAERARFLTGADSVAVALGQDGHFAYCAATGSAAPETGTIADVTRHPLGECIKTGQAARLLVERLSAEASAQGFHLAVPLLKDGKVVGFFELAPGASTFTDADVETVARLAALASTALDHLDAAEHTESLIGEAAPEKPAPRLSPVLWHAPEPSAAEPAPAESLPLPAPAEVHACTVCGFPVSGIRTVCVDCDARRYDLRDDQKAHPKPGPNPPAELFAPQNQESWIEAHGYTIASLLVTALAAAIIYWLR
jgi:GAF domain